MASEQPLATSVVTFRVEHWLDPLQAPCQSLRKVALGGLVWPRPSFGMVRWGPHVLLACPLEAATWEGRWS